MVQLPCFIDYYGYPEDRVCLDSRNKIGPDGFCGPHRPPSDMSAERAERTFLTQGEMLAAAREEGRLSGLTEAAGIARARAEDDEVTLAREAEARAIAAAIEARAKEAGDGGERSG